MSASFENETIDETDNQYSPGTKKLNHNSKHVERIFENLEGSLKIKGLQANNKKLYKNNLYSQNINRKKVKFNKDIKIIDVECWKEYNLENTVEENFDDLNNENSDKKDEENNIRKKNDKKEKISCTCLII